MSPLLPQAHRPATWAPKSWVWEPRVVEGPRALTHSTGPVGLCAEVTWVAKVGDGAGQGARDEGISHGCPGNCQGGVEDLWAGSQVLSFQAGRPILRGPHQPHPTAPGRQATPFPMTEFFESKGCVPFSNPGS